MFVGRDDVLQSEELVQQIRDFVRKTGKPHLWPGHTHTKPPAGSKPIYIEEFDLPDWCKPAHLWAPCPCCSPDKPKYLRKGKIAYFPAEGVIRLIGPDCYASLDQEGHERAKTDMHRRRKERQDREYLLKHIDKVPALMRDAHDTVPVAEAIDLLRSKLNLVDSGTFMLLMGTIAKHEQLRVKTSYTQTYLQAGEQRERITEDFKPYAEAKWLRFFSDRYKPIKPQLVSLWQKMRDLPNSSAVTEASRPEERHIIAVRLRKYHSELVELVGQLRLCQAALEGEALATLRTWGALSDAELQIFYDVRPDLTLSVGLRSSGKANLVKINHHAFDRIPHFRALDHI